LYKPLAKSKGDGEFIPTQKLEIYNYLLDTTPHAKIMLKHTGAWEGVGQKKQDHFMLQLITL